MKYLIITMLLAGLTNSINAQDYLAPIYQAQTKPTTPPTGPWSSQLVLFNDTLFTWSGSSLIKIKNVEGPAGVNPTPSFQDVTDVGSTTTNIVQASEFRTTGASYTRAVGGNVILNGNPAYTTNVTPAGQMWWRTTPTGGGSFLNIMKLGEFGINTDIAIGIGRLANRGFKLDVAGTVDATGQISANSMLSRGTIQATAFIGDASQLTAANATAANALTTLGQVQALVPVILSGTATIDFPSVAANSSNTQTFIVAGADTGDVVVLGTDAATIPNANFTVRVSATNTIAVAFNNNSGAAIDLASQIFKVKVFK